MRFRNQMLLFSVLGLGCAAVSFFFFSDAFKMNEKTAVPRGPTNSYENQPISKSFEPFEDISKEALLDLIAANPQADTMEKFLEILPKNFMSSYTLATHSKSLQKATPTNPRAIVFGKSAQTIMAFDGGGETKASDVIEVINWDEKTKSFEFSEIVFQLGQSPKLASSSECMQCHSNNGVGMIPRWDEYDRWPDFYGEDDDFIGPQMKDFSEFKKIQPTHARYKHLAFEGRPQSFPYYSDDPNNKETNVQSPTGRNFFTSPNLRLTAHLTMKTVNQALSFVEKNKLSDLARLLMVMDCKDILYESLFSKVKQSYSKKASRYLPAKWSYEKGAPVMENILKEGLFLKYGIDKVGAAPYPDTPKLSISEMIGKRIGIGRTSLRRDRAASRHISGAYSFAYRGEEYNSGFASLGAHFKEVWIRKNFSQEPWFKAASSQLYEEKIPSNDLFNANAAEAGLAVYPIFEDIIGCANRSQSDVSSKETDQLNKKLFGEAQEAYMRTIDAFMRK